MANLGNKNGIYHVRFRFQRTEYKKSLKTRDREDAQAAVKGIEQTIHLVTVGRLQVPAGVDPGDFIANGGKVPATCGRRRIDRIRPLPAAVDEYLESLHGRLADSYIKSQQTHLKHLQGFLEGSDRKPLQKITFGHLDRFLQARRRKQDATTVSKERNTLRHFFAWCLNRRYIQDSPADALAPIPHGREMDRFRTKAQVEQILDRGGMTDTEIRGLWKCLYLTTDEIAALLKLVRERASHDTAFLLHAIPAYTGMRRGEVLRLRWTDIDATSRIITAYSRKQSRTQEFTPRDIDMHDDLCRELVAWRARRPKGQFVVCHANSLACLANDEANRYFWQPMRRTEWCLKGSKNWFKVTFHTYRHSFASNLASLGVDQRLIDKFMGHQTKEMRRRYQHLFPNDCRSAIERLSFPGAIDD